MEVAVLGGGYAGTRLARELEQGLPEAVELSIVDDTGTHVLQHELHRLIRFPELRDQVSMALDELLDRTRVIEGRVTEIEEEAGRARLADGRTIDPDILAICLGAVTGIDVIPGVKDHAQPLNRIEHALAIRDRFDELAPDGRVVVGGAGLSGIQVAGELAAIRDAAGQDRDIILIEQDENVAPRFPRPFREAVETALLEAGIEIRTESPIRNVSPTEVELGDGESLSSAHVVWTGGIAGSLATDGHRLPVRSDLRVSDRVFALGDAAQVVDDHGRRVPAAAQTAVRQAPIAAENIGRLVTSELDEGSLVFEPRLRRYVYDSPGWVVSVGDDAVGQVRDRIVRGTAANALKASVTVRYLGSIGEVRRALDTVTDTIGWPTANEANG